ncbi:MAG: ABC transporter permease, partial [Bacteroidales bacterium]|nr:ABC transporter permease [Bacteroidales bacterium]
MKQFIRNFNKQKVVGVLNICSLSLGVMVAVIVGLWTINELSFDNFHKDKDRMYRIVEHITLNGSPTKLGSTFMPFGDAAKAVIPEIEDMCRVVINNGGEIRIAQTLHLQNKVLMVDANFFSFFTFPLTEGHPEDVLSAPNKVVISENAAANFFPRQDAIGQNIRYEEQDFAVSGVMKNMPLNSSFRGDIIFPFFGAYLTEVWGQRDNKTT